ncbi:FadR/GntR family transcriptional regulator [Leifsonia naganoensis]|uniref:DNA-binding FadR family transcriptional regulator n=1 Tax=Leifsonia naganoensis TaxID=150025 RepID=A0A853DLV5_9MICO|nr:FCD domain-containing protein [Leifsonia naganoensis]NYK08479.1 DNA-binding FadR family transcriptional regulator [Leifsonia naganoensis]
MPVLRAPLADQAADALLERIRAGEWALGQKLPGETTLAPQLGVGRSTVREAIRQLAGRGVLQSRQGAGVFVTALDAPEDWDAVLRRASIVSVIEARIAIESEAAALAAERRTPQELRALRRALDARSRLDRELEAHVDADTAFHRAIVAAAHNDILAELFDGFVPRLRQSMVEMLRLRPLADEGADHDAHRALLDAIADRDALVASRLSRDHLTSMKERLS